ncbi:hypothetical protein SeMB42_g04210 [Synchytrium endobioticum]|uniref:Uncharacterized protein n=1 Tax=Synchytrium endobioticum TaxID=286115 RepID=A0A507D0P7_9FUNG|nr:hypothetical protein SeLEV6574_g07198 [Synchytrium endobioticum]TPX44760.1 hypothetical protein SeMB42_g04210 [Synchytrium endobioticum]
MNTTHHSNQHEQVASKSCFVVDVATPAGFRSANGTETNFVTDAYVVLVRNPQDTNITMGSIQPACLGLGIIHNWHYPPAASMVGL